MTATEASGRAGRRVRLRVRASLKGRSGGERGQATVAALGVIGAVFALTLGAIDVARAVVLSHRARAAADLGALAAAGAAVRGAGQAEACGAAARVARANGATVLSCSGAPGAVVTVTTQVSSRVPWQRTAQAAARAGPG